jgi:hypothetical protein
LVAAVELDIRKNLGSEIFGQPFFSMHITSQYSCLDHNMAAASMRNFEKMTVEEILLTPFVPYPTNCKKSY